MLGRQSLVSVFRRAINEPSSSFFIAMKLRYRIKTTYMTSIANSFSYSSAKMYNQNSQTAQLDMNNIELPLKPQVENDKRIYSMSGSTNVNSQSEENDKGKPKSKHNDNDNGGSNQRSTKVKSNEPPRRLPHFYGFLLRRVALTAQLYLDAPAEKQALVDEDSRYYYVKPIVEKLTMNERKSLRAYLNNLKKEVYHKQRTEEELAELKAKGIPLHSEKAKLSKQFVEEFITSKHTDTLIKLNEEFIKPGNRDFELYMSNEMDEKQIGKVVNANKTYRSKTWATFQKNIEHCKDRYAGLLKDVKAKQENLSREENKEENTQP